MGAVDSLARWQAVGLLQHAQMKVFYLPYRGSVGKWSAPHCLREARGWIDPRPFWDDNGQAWLVHAFAHSRSGIKHKLQLFAMAPDASELLGEGQIIYDGCCDLPTLEGPKVYQRAGWYYIFAPAGGVENGWQTVLRARQMTGPQEAKTCFSVETPR